MNQQAHHFAAADRRLLAFSFRERPVFRMRFDAHVRQWDRHMRRQVWRRWHTDPGFAAEYQRRVEAFRDCPVGRDAGLVEINHG
jgi:hypothetical protein